MANSSDSETASASAISSREVRFAHSTDLADWLSGQRLTMLVSTYQAGKVAVIGTQGVGDRHKLDLSFHNVDRPMGMAVDEGRGVMAIAGRNSIWFLRNAPTIARQMSEAARYDSCWLTRSATVTGEIQAHEIGWSGGELWVVNTLFSCLCTLAPDFSFVPRWQPPFVRGLAAEDRCHLNGMAMDADRPRFVTAMAETDQAGGWRAAKHETGCVVDVDSGETVVRGFAMPHSPRVHRDALWVLDSGRGSLVRIDARSGQMEVIARFPGYTRGLAIVHDFAFVGLSRIRETSTFGGVPIAENRERLKCGVAIVDLVRGTLLGQFEFQSGVEEIFDVTVLRDTAMAALRGPHPHEDGAATVWVVPETEANRNSFPTLNTSAEKFRD